MKKLVTALFIAAMIGFALPATAQKKSKASKAVQYEYVTIIKYQTYRMEVKELQNLTHEGDRFRRPGGEMISAQFATSAYEYHIEVLNQEERGMFTESTLNARTTTQLLNVLGDYGFSLCGNSSIAHDGGLEVHTYILKRPKK
jgi:hypothetical protein